MAASLGGAWFVFSPALPGELYQGHLQVTFLPLLPAIVALCDDAIVRQHRRLASTGTLLGTAVAAQHLVGPYDWHPPPARLGAGGWARATPKCRVVPRSAPSRSARAPSSRRSRMPRQARRCGSTRRRYAEGWLASRQAAWSS